MPKNKYGISGFEDWEKGTFGYEWLGAPVSFILLGQWVKGKVIDFDVVPFLHTMVILPLTNPHLISI